MYLISKSYINFQQPQIPQLLLVIKKINNSTIFIIYTYNYGVNTLTLKATMIRAH